MFDVILIVSEIFVFRISPDDLDISDDSSSESDGASSLLPSLWLDRRILAVEAAKPGLPLYFDSAQK